MPTYCCKRANRIPSSPVSDKTRAAVSGVMSQQEVIKKERIFAFLSTAEVALGYTSTVSDNRFAFVTHGVRAHPPRSAVLPIAWIGLRITQT